MTKVICDARSCAFNKWGICTRSEVEILQVKLDIVDGFLSGEPVCSDYLMINKTGKKATP